MVEIEGAHEAKFWLQQIYDYIATGNEEAASQVILGIYDRVQILRQFPELGQRYGKYPESASAFFCTDTTGSLTGFETKKPSTSSEFYMVPWISTNTSNAFFN